MLRENQAAKQEEETTTGTRTTQRNNTRLDKFFKYSLIKRKQDATLNKGTKESEDDYSPPPDYSSGNDHELEDADDTSSYAGESRKKKKVSRPAPRSGAYNKRSTKAAKKQGKLMQQ